MTSVDHTALIHRLAEVVYNQRNLAETTTIYAPTVMLNGEAHCVAELEEAIRSLHNVLPDAHATLDVMFTCGDIVVVEWKNGRGQQREPTASWTSIRLFRIADGKIVEEWRNWAALDRLHELETLHRPASLPRSFEVMATA